MDYSHKSIFLWCRDATRRIRYKPDRAAVEQELHEHMEDRYQSFLDRGFDPDEAAQKSVEAMGSAEEVSKLLVKLYNPVWPWLLKISRILIVIAFLLALFPVIEFVKHNIFCASMVSSYYSYQHYIDYDPYKDIDYLGEDGIGERLQVYEPEYHGSITQFPMTVTDIALWNYGVNINHRYDLLHIRMEMQHPSLILTDIATDTVDYVWAEDSEGNYYYSAAESIHGGSFGTHRKEAYIYGTVRDGGWGNRVMELTLVQFASHDAQWLDLHYDRDGRDYALRIYLNGEGDDSREN